MHGQLSSSAELQLAPALVPILMQLIEVLETGHMTRLEQLRQKGAPQGGQGRVSPRAEVWGFGEKAAQQLREGHGEVRLR